jgi:hypothetical protein
MYCALIEIYVRGSYARCGCISIFFIFCVINFHFFCEINSQMMLNISHFLINTKSITTSRKNREFELQIFIHMKYKQKVSVEHEQLTPIILCMR